MELVNNLREICNRKLAETNDRKYELIGKILSDDDCFFIVDMDIMLDILASLDVENPKEYYNNVIGYENVSKSLVKIVD